MFTRLLLTAAFAVLLPMSANAVCPDAASLPDGSFCIEWTNPTLNEDGSPLTDLESLRIYASWTSPVTSASPFITVDDETLTEATNDVGALAVGSPPGGEDIVGGSVPLYFKMAAVNSIGEVSALSNEVPDVVVFNALRPGMPTVIKVIIATQQ